MIILKPPRTPWPILLISWIAALILAAMIAHLVFTFGYYASGLAAFKEDERRRSETPIPLSFAEPGGDPNAASPPSPSGTTPPPNQQGAGD